MTEPTLRREWPLAVFTVAVQFGCGFALAIVVADFSVVSPGIAQYLRLGLACVVVTGLLASLTHLGRPLAAWGALRNLRRSRLSAEILLTAMFASCTLAQAIAPRTAIDLLTLCSGVAAVAAGAVIYMLPAQSHWNSGWLPLSFFGTVLLAAGTAGLACRLNAAAGVLLMFVLAGALLLLVSVVWMSRHVRVHAIELAAIVLLLAASAALANVAPLAALATGTTAAIFGRLLMFSPAVKPACEFARQL